MQHQLHPKCSGEVLPYLEIKKQESQDEMIKSIEMPDVTGISVAEAEKILKELELDVSIEGKTETDNEENTTEKVVIEQLPKKGIQVNIGTKVTIYIK